MKTTEIKIKYSSERVRALRSVLSRKNTTLDIEISELLDQLYKKSVKPEVREFIAELETEE
ncbi:hypothetical protein [Anaerorhabdus sp.]|uniref:hypothetical protein n=1 Tax=Anaerorhabdus sp. TaxID=1872524 RepID=UPI002FCB0234